MSNESPLRFPGLTMVRSVGESKAINNHKQPCIIMSTSGMCTAGRIKHHLRANIGRAESTILFVGYQAHGTLGRQIVEGKPLVRIHGKPMEGESRRCGISTDFQGMPTGPHCCGGSAICSVRPRHVFLTHGEQVGQRAFCRRNHAPTRLARVDSPVSPNSQPGRLGQLLNATVDPVLSPTGGLADGQNGHGWVF